uniref:Uncharacterized protein n=1 Tax=Setaria italica TaxID=4555 RepID=K4AN84_SETIT
MDHASVACYKCSFEIRNTSHMLADLVACKI